MMTVRGSGGRSDMVHASAASASAHLNCLAKMYETMKAALTNVGAMWTKVGEVEISFRHRQNKSWGSNR